MQFSATDLTDKRFGSLTAIKREGKAADGHATWLCICDCGNTKTINASYLKRGTTKHCGCQKHGLFKGYGDVSKTYFNNCKYHAESRNIDFQISIEDIWNQFMLQDGICALSGVKLTLNTKWNKNTASLDRINSSKGYLKTNIQWIHKTLNQMKMDLAQEEFIEWCKLIAKYKA